MQLKSVLIFVIIGAVYLNESEAAPKLGLIKAKIAIAKAPHIIAKVGVAKEVKLKSKIAAVKTFEAAKATKVAFLSALTAPFRAAKKTIALKIGAVKALKALKVAKIAKTAAIIKNLKKSPIILPVPVAVPLKALPIVKPFPVLPSLAAFNLPSPSLNAALGPFQEIISGAQSAIKTASSAVPILSTFTNGFGRPNEKIVIPAPVTTASVYQYVPKVDFVNINKVNNLPQIADEVPSVSAFKEPIAVYSPSIPVLTANSVPN